MWARFRPSLAYFRAQLGPLGAILAVLGDAPEFERADLGAAGGERDRDALRAAAFTAAQDGVQWRHLQELRRGDIEQVTSLVVGPHGRRVERKHHRLPERQLQLRLRQRDLLPFLKMLRHHTQDGRLVAGGGGLALHRDVIGPRDAAADTPAAGVLEPGEIRRSTGDGQIERRIG